MKAATSNATKSAQNTNIRKLSHHDRTILVATASIMFVTLVFVDSGYSQDITAYDSPEGVESVSTSALQSNPLPALIDFNSDTPGQPPNIGGINQPTSLTYRGDNTTILVESTANGIITQPVLLSTDDYTDYVSADIRFDPVTSGIARVEATVSFDRLTDGYFFQTSLGPTTAVVTRLAMSDEGEIQDYKARMPLGWYEPNQPFRVRMDIDMDEKLWSVVVDNELNGFSDDEVFSNLEFINPPSTITQVGAAHISLSTLPTAAGLNGATVAYDDVSISRGPAIQVSIDIKPGSKGNTINLRSSGVIPVAIIGSDSFDALTVEPSTIFLTAAVVRVAGSSNRFLCHEQDVNNDGWYDLVCNVETAEFLVQPGEDTVELTAETTDGISIRGTDSIRIVPR